MTWKAKAQLFHDPSQAEFQPGDVVPDAVVADSPWLVEAGLVVDPEAKPVVQDEPAPEAPADDEVNLDYPEAVPVAADAPAAEQPAADAVNPDDPEAVPADEEG